MTHESKRCGSTLHMSLSRLQDSSRTDPWFGRGPFVGTTGDDQGLCIGCLWPCFFAQLWVISAVFFGKLRRGSRLGVGSCAVHVCLGSAAKKKEQVHSEL